MSSSVLIGGCVDDGECEPPTEQERSLNLEPTEGRGIILNYVVKGGQEQWFQGVIESVLPLELDAGKSRAQEVAVNVGRKFEVKVRFPDGGSDVVAFPWGEEEDVIVVLPAKVRSGVFAKTNAQPGLADHTAQEPCDIRSPHFVDQPRGGV